MVIVTPKRNSGEARIASVSAAYRRENISGNKLEMVIVTRIELVTPTMST